ncbi:MFS transporter [Lentzea sp. NPDC004782]|uniref:MFS transporter n=1 Tax=Lentzea sp. NPDC004782 TaxID=3154458 RepID=UPI0033BE6369
MDLRPLRQKDFRLVWLSGAVTMLGTVFTMTAVPLQIAAITGSPLAVGAVGVVELLPSIAFGLYGGVLADRFDRRTIALVTEVALAAVVALLLLNPTSLVFLFGSAAAAAALQGVQQPALEAMIPRLVPRDQLVAAGGLLGLRWGVGGIFAPAAAGIVIITAGVTTAFAFDLVTFAVSVALLARVRAVRAAPDAEWPRFVDGARYVASRPDLIGTYLVDLAATVLALPTALFPFLAADRPWAVGFLYSASALGVLVAATTGGWTSRVTRHGRWVLVAAALVGVAMIGVAVSRDIWFVVAFLALAGAANWLGDTFRGAIWNGTIPDELRGRLAGVEMLVGSVGPALGDLRAGAMAARFGIRKTVAIGGVACLSSAGVLTAALPSLWRYEDQLQ